MVGRRLEGRVPVASGKPTIVYIIAKAALAGRTEIALTQDSPFEIKYVTGTKVYLDESGETVISIGYVEIPDSHQPHIIGSFAASSSVAEAYCRQLMEVLGIKEMEWPNEPKES
jgi:hypothetical protein